MKTERRAIPIEDGPVDTVGALHQVPEDDRGGSVILLAHGAGAPMDSAFMETVATGLADGGYPVLRFNYAYTERMQREEKRRPPDRRPVLEKVHRAAAAALRELHPGRRLVLAGKSMGGRLSSLLAADGEPCDGLAFFGYPLHAPGRTESLRTSHFEDVRQPALFLQGSRDALCKLELLRPALEGFAGQATLEVVDDADHDFKVPKRTGLTREEVLAGLVETTLAWAASI